MKKLSLDFFFPVQFRLLYFLLFQRALWCGRAGTSGLLIERKGRMWKRRQFLLSVQTGQAELAEKSGRWCRWTLCFAVCASFSKQNIETPQWCLPHRCRPETSCKEVLQKTHTWSPRILFLYQHCYCYKVKDKGAKQKANPIATHNKHTMHLWVF